MARSALKQELFRVYLANCKFESRFGIVIQPLEIAPIQLTYHDDDRAILVQGRLELIIYIAFNPRNLKGI